MKETERRKKQADAILAGAPEIGGRVCDVSTVGKMLVLERRGNKYFGGDAGAGDIEAMTEVLFVATRDESELKEMSRLDVADWRDVIYDFANDVTMDDVNAFGQYFESTLGQVSASAVEAEPSKEAPGKLKAG